MRDIFREVHKEVEKLVEHAKSVGAKIELIDMLIHNLEQAKVNLRKGIKEN